MKHVLRLTKSAFPCGLVHAHALNPAFFLLTSLEENAISETPLSSFAPCTCFTAVGGEDMLRRHSPVRRKLKRLMIHLVANSVQTLGYMRWRPDQASRKKAERCRA